MAHQLVLFINLAGLLLLELFLGADVSITQNIPATMTPGSEVRVNVTVNKASLGGFAKLQLDLPPGLTVTAIETKGASFTFADQKAKFIWMALPSTPNFRLSYTLSADASASGPLEIKGRFSYIEDNERKTYDLPVAIVDLGASGAVVASVPEPVVSETAAADEEEAPSGNQDLVSAAGGAPASNTPFVIIERSSVPPMQGVGGVNGTRTITAITEKEMVVEVTVKKGDIRGFGKLQEVIPQGFTATEKSSDEAIFTTQDRIVKFVWLNLPSKSEVTVSYKLRANERPDGDYSIDGEFGYLKNEETQKAIIGTSRFFVGPKAMETMASDGSSMGSLDGADPSLSLNARAKADAEAAKAKQEAEARKAQEEAAARKAKEEAASTAQATKPKTTATTPPAKSTSIPAPERGVTYKVQITAAHKEVGKAYFQARHRYSGNFSIERHQGWIKYVTGSYTNYSEARDQRVNFVQAGHNFPGPFVTAYNNGERITVQEALLISNQKWVQ
ncbi:MAG: hypothetical protein KF905_16210 [Flavobacteriales bacterium]|nr:hypothetical protein [Flavobacteriales bacterium]